MNPPAGSAPTPDLEVRGFYLQRDARGRLALSYRERPEWKPLVVDWTTPELASRIRAGRRQALGRATGLHRHGPLRILDATAGLGHDGFTLAGLGAQMTLIERDPLVVQLLSDALCRARSAEAAWVRDAASRVRIVQADTRRLSKTELDVEVAYLDPMYDDDRRQALPQKSMQMLRYLVGEDPDAGDLLQQLRQSVPRVVVKRPDRAPTLDAQPASLSFSTRQARFDVYLSATSA